MQKNRLVPYTIQLYFQIDCLSAAELSLINFYIIATTTTTTTPCHDTCYRLDCNSMYSCNFTCPNETCSIWATTTTTITTTTVLTTEAPANCSALEAELTRVKLGLGIGLGSGMVATSGAAIGTYIYYSRR